MKPFGWVVLLILLAGCGGGGGGGGSSPPADGDAYGTLTWSPDILGANFSEVGVPPPITRNKLYKLITGTHTVYWTSDWLGCCNNYSVVVKIQGGTPGKDRIYNAAIGQNKVIWTESLVAFNVDVQPLDAVPPQELPDFDGEEFEEGRLF